VSELTIKLENLQATLTDPVSDEDIRAAWSMVDEIIGEVRQLEAKLIIPKRVKRITPDIVPLDDGGLVQKAQPPPKEDKRGY